MDIIYCALSRHAKKKETKFRLVSIIATVVMTYQTSPPAPPPPASPTPPRAVYKWEKSPASPTPPRAVYKWEKSPAQTVFMHSGRHRIQSLGKSFSVLAAPVPDLAIWGHIFNTSCQEKSGCQTLCCRVAHGNEMSAVRGGNQSSVVQSSRVQLL